MPSTQYLTSDTQLSKQSCQTKAPTIQYPIPIPQSAKLISQFLIQTGDHTFCAVALWESEAALIAARPQMISFLDTIRDQLEELPGDLGVTDAVSGQVVAET